jgi:DNA-binding response OmpR family regulator
MNPPSGRSILVIEDEAPLAAALRYSLQKEGFQVFSASDGLDGLEKARSLRPNLIILDLMLPRLDGIEVCRRLRAASNVPILILTARADEVDKVVGLEVGADDYMTKPFGMRELIARVRALLRRGGDVATGDRPITVAGLTIDPRGRTVRRDDGEVRLHPREFELLYFLASHPGQAFTREQIIERVWGYDFPGDARTVDVHVRWLRAKLEDDPAHPVHLLTVRGVGYKLVT